MFWFGCLTGYLVGTIVTLLMIYIYFMYMDRKADRTESNWNEITSIDESVKKEMEQLKAIKNDKG